MHVNLESVQLKVIGNRGNWEEKKEIKQKSDR